MQDIKPVDFSKEKIQNDKISFMALGGLGEVGKNMYVIEINNKIYLVDCGVLFPDDNLPGIDYIIPSFQYLLDNKERIVALFITHGHEDHIGAIPFLLKSLEIKKIYACGIAYDLINAKLDEHNIKYNLLRYYSNTILNFDDVQVSFVLLNHSIPDMHGVAFKTKNGYIFHTGDFKIDLTPAGPHAEYYKLAKMGEEGVLALLSDSTNALKKAPIESEKVIGDSIVDLFSRIKGRIIIATFASNIYRIEQIINAAILNKRKMAVFGRSMQKAIEIALKSNYLKVDPSLFIKPEAIKNTKPSELVVLSTGTQGEPLAALSRIANGTHRFLSATSKDTVIFSSSVIPGNTDAINQTINLLYKKGCEVITDGPLADIHTSGHGSQNDLKLMLTLLRPKYFIPIHGENRMLKKHCQLAQDIGIKKENTIVLDNGEMIDIVNGLKFIKKIPCHNQYMDNFGYSAINNNIIKERRIISEDGIFSIIALIDPVNAKLLSNPIIISRGFIYMKDNEEFIQSISNIAKVQILNILKNKKFNFSKIIEEDMIRILSNHINQTTGRNPVIMPIIHEIWWTITI